jgi:hypothetical protein
MAAFSLLFGVGAMVRNAAQSCIKKARAPITGGSEWLSQER